MEFRLKIVRIITSDAQDFFSIIGEVDFGIIRMGDKVTIEHNGKKKQFVVSGIIIQNYYLQITIKSKDEFLKTIEKGDYLFK